VSDECCEKIQTVPHNLSKILAEMCEGVSRYNGSTDK
jgi:hypothetical protein